MIFFVCPHNARLDPNAQSVCRRYDSMMHSVVPYVKPYYDTYAEPTLARMQPYLLKGQAYYDQFGAPAVAKGQDLWVKEASPRISHGITTAQHHYNTNVYPVLDRTVLKSSRDVYSKYLDSHVQTVSGYYTKSVHPYVHTLGNHAQSFYYDRLVPAYEYATPRVQYALQKAEDGYEAHVQPRVHTAIKWTVAKFETVVVPRIVILWGVHVQPQLDRIYDKVFRNREAKQVASKVVQEAKSTQRYASQKCFSN
jgi:hypothetical protein